VLRRRASQPLTVAPLFSIQRDVRVEKAGVEFEERWVADSEHARRALKVHALGSLRGKMI